MDKKRIEESLVTLRLKELETIDRDSTQVSLRMTLGVIAFFGIVVANGFLSISDELTAAILVGFLTALVLLAWFGEQTLSHVTDCYSSFAKALKDNRVLDFELPTFTWRDYFYYVDKA
jgi:hypothetical protein